MYDYYQINDRNRQHSERQRRVIIRSTDSPCSFHCSWIDRTIRSHINRQCQVYGVEPVMINRPDRLHTNETSDRTTHTSRRSIEACVYYSRIESPIMPTQSKGDYHVCLVTDCYISLSYRYHSPRPLKAVSGCK